MRELDTKTAPLDGVRVLDFSIMLAGPYCARLLADVGADVIKIEPPEGDDMRLRTPLRKGQSAYFGQLNAGKRSLALDLKSADAIKLVHRLVEETDIVVENFRPGVKDRPAAGAVFVADVLGGIFGYSAIQTALVQRARTGEGQRIDVALMDCMLNMLIFELQEAQFPTPSPRHTYGPVRARDGDILIAPITPRNFTALCEVT